MAHLWSLFIYFLSKKVLDHLNRAKAYSICNVGIIMVICTFSTLITVFRQPVHKGSRPRPGFPLPAGATVRGVRQGQTPAIPSQ